MTAYKGQLLLLKIADATSADVFHTVAGLRTTRLLVNRALVEQRMVDGGAWRQAMGEAGKTALRVQGNGVFTDSTGEKRLLHYVFSGAVTVYRFCLGNGDWVEVPCMVSQYERSGAMGQMEAFSITLESAGAAAYHTA